MTTPSLRATLPAGQNNDVVGGLAEMSFLTPTTVVGVSHTGMIVRSTDAGATWQAAWSGMAFASHVYFRDAQVGIVIGSRIMRTADGGLTWTTDEGATTELEGAATRPSARTR